VLPDTRKKLGDFGERTAESYLLRQGCSLVARKWRSAAGEIDLVMRDGAALVFVEVRTRRGQPAGAAEESVNLAKQVRLVNVAYAYLDAASLPADLPWRIDVVAIDVDRSGRITRLAHLRDAIEAH
jgi:putative endonuclease